MKIKGTHYRTIWPHADGTSVEIIDQTQLPHLFATAKLSTIDQAARAIRTMMVRGAPLIGATAAYGIAFAMRDDASDDALDAAHDLLLATRPTACLAPVALSTSARALWSASIAAGRVWIIEDSRERADRAGCLHN